ncbi:MAG: HAMP domain-containing protein, partial [Leptospiraceae bacterium]|nr:HAMP domain-containing protein [Leptospiraceae bacterium]
MKFFQRFFKRKEKTFRENELEETPQTLYAIPIGVQEKLESSKPTSSKSTKTYRKIAIPLEDSKEEQAVSATAETDQIKEKESKEKISSESLSQQEEDKTEETSIATLSKKENTQNYKQEERPISNLATKPKFSLQNKMMVVITIILTLVVSSIIFLATYFFKSDNKVRILENNLELVRIVELKVRADLNAVVEKGKQLALVINQEFKNPKQKEFFIEQFFKNDDDFIYLALLTKNDDSLIIKKEVFNQNYLQKIALTEEDIKAVINKNFPTFARSFDGASILINTSAGFEEPSLCISIPPQEDSTEKYVLVIMLKLQTILDAFGKSGITETFMVSGDGTIIAHPKKEFVLSAKNVSDNPIVREMLTSMAMNGLKEFELDGRKFLGSYQKLKLKFNNVGIISTVPEDKAFEAVYRIQERNLYIMMISLCSAVIIVILFARTISKPVMRLLQETVKIASGNFQVDIKRTTNDEVGLLSDYFVNMAKGLEEREKVKSILGSMIDPV